MFLLTNYEHIVKHPTDEKMENRQLENNVIDLSPDNSCHFK